MSAESTTELDAMKSQTKEKFRETDVKPTPVGGGPSCPGAPYPPGAIGGRVPGGYWACPGGPVWLGGRAGGAPGYDGPPGYPPPPGAAEQSEEFVDHLPR